MNISHSIQLITELVKSNFIDNYGSGLTSVFKVLARPFFVLIIFTLVFDKFIKVETGNISYPVFAFSGLIVWECFFSSFVSSISSMSKHSEIIKYFPISVITLEIVEMSNVFLEAIIKVLVFGLISFLLKGTVSTVGLLCFLIFITIPIFIGYGLGLWVVLLDFKRKLFANQIPYFLSYLMWVTPVFFTENLIPVKFKFIVYLNPIAELIFFTRKMVLNIDFNATYNGLVTSLFVAISFIGFYTFYKLRFNLIETL